MNNGRDMFLRNALENEKGGVALIFVIWVLVILVAIVGEFSYSMRTETNIARNFKEEEEAYQLALAGVEQAKFELLSVKEPTVVYLDGDNVLAFESLLVFEEEEQEKTVRSGTLGSGSFEYTIEDEDGKLNVNTAASEALKNLFDDSGVDSEEVDTIVDSIMDWRDTNEEHHLNGAEEDYYRGLETPYSSKDGHFYSIEELLLVKGMTREILYGSKNDGDNEEDGSNEEDEEDESDFEGVDKYLTVYGSAKININTAPEVVLQAVVGLDEASNILSIRSEGPISSPMEAGKVSSELFTITSTGTNSDGTIKRSIKTTILKKNNSLETKYWNDNIIG